MSKSVELRSQVNYALAIAVCLYIALQLLTRPSSYGDTPVYANDILAHSLRQFGPGRDPLWEFGHVLWRPLGYIVWLAALPLVQQHFSDAPVLGVYSVLIALNVIAGLVCTIVVFRLALNLCRRPWLALLCTIGFLCTNAALNYMHSGTAYIPGLMFQLVGLYLLERSIAERRFTAARAWMVAAAWGLSVCMWFTYVLSLPGMLLFGLIWGNPEWSWRVSTPRIRYLLRICIGLAVVVGAAYLLATEKNGIRDPQQAVDWFRQASHGIAVSGGYIRVATGIPRTFFFLGDDGLLLKRYVTKDPYAPVSFSDLFEASLWKFAVVYLALATVLLLLSRSPPGRKMLMALMGAALPLLAFAVFLFETSQSERYLPVYAILFAAFSYAISIAPAAVRVLLGGFLVSMIISNVISLSGASAEKMFAPAIARIEVLHAAMQPQDEALLLSFRDDASRFRWQLPFHPVNRRRPTVFHYAVVPGAADAKLWRRAVAQRLQNIWESQSQLWISKRLISDTPAPSWRWAEADDPNLKWKQLSSFFQQFDRGIEVGGDDGFFVVPPSEHNRAIVEKFLRSG